MFKIFKNFEGNDIAGSIYGAESDPLVIFCMVEVRQDLLGTMQQKIFQKKAFTLLLMISEAMETVFGQKQETTRFMIIKKI